MPITVILERQPHEAEPAPMLVSAIEEGTRELRDASRNIQADKASAWMRCFRAETLRAELGETLRRADAGCRAEQALSPVERAECRSALARLKRMLLELSVTAISPSEDAAERFVSRFEALVEGWDEWTSRLGEPATPRA